MIKWYQSLYMDEAVRKKEEKYKRKIEKGKITDNLYCIVLPSNQENLYDIIGCNELLFAHYRRNSIYIIGLAKGYENAVELLMQIVSQVYEETKDYASKDYFLKDQFECRC